MSRLYRGYATAEPGMGHEKRHEDILFRILAHFEPDDLLIHSC